MFTSFEIARFNLSISIKHLLCISVVIFAVLFPLNPSYGDLCPKWDGGKKTGQLDHSFINEASGIAVSSKYPGRIYHVNDSGGGPYFYTTEMSGSKIKKVKIEGFNNNRSDFEDLSLGRCNSGNTCLFIADIGDNRERRKYVEIIVIEERENYGSSVTPVKTIKLVYPDRAHNAEGIAVHPNGDIYILTKEEDLDKIEAYPSRLYKLDYKKRKNAGESLVLLDYVGEIDLPALTPESTAFGQIPTSLDISPDGKSFLILTYENAIELNHDFSVSELKDTKDMKAGTDFNIIELRSLPQQESVSYLPDESGFIYNTEYKLFSVPLISVMCLE
jgi:hypothetical protein